MRTSEDNYSLDHSSAENFSALDACAVNET